MAKKIYVWAKQPGSPARHVYISNSLANLQRYVGGYIETVTIAENATIICNEEGRLQNLPFNCEIDDVDFVGPVILAGVDGDELCDFPVTDIKTMKKMFPQLWEESEVKYE